MTNLTKPVIGVVCRELSDPEYEIPAQGCTSAYLESISQVGGIPLLIPLYSDAELDILRVASLCDGVLLAGGEDVSPELYGASRHPALGVTSQRRDAVELSIFKKARSLKRPILGICRGLQLMNVALGGTLFQDLLSERATSFDHETKDNCWESSPHRVSVAEGSILSRTTQLSNFPVNSIHHQAIKALAPDLAVAARSEIDGIIEAVEIPGDEFSMAVQWHPEIFTSRTGTQESLVSLAIFGAFIEGARRSALRR